MGRGAVGGAGAWRNENVPLFHKPLGMGLRENAPRCSKNNATKIMLLHLERVELAEPSSVG